MNNPYSNISDIRWHVTLVHLMIVEFPNQTAGEMLVGPVMALFMDEISNGLDSSTTFQIVNYLKQYIHIFNGTAVISLLQPAPETYDLFDDIIILSDGQIVYQGPRESVLEFFEHMGFRCPKRKGVADFLQEVSIIGRFLCTFIIIGLHLRKPVCIKCQITTQPKSSGCWVRPQ